ncbi:monooxygenase [Nocardioides zeae]|uniref:Monooxygenase n=1 Tax=Nocardioides zeae TaxID=1457234 RepID=A0ACC6IEC4_9ACTN|nr:NAD(P)/FAD-dependent oxidoreductase [Nocardioides zeae]MDR6174198.1 monooxygenase [Nocardioides zeae]MDR6209005.1 monooxygenase [Nocardioides zeae]
MSTTAVEHCDVLVVGAGLSGIGVACQLEDQRPGRSVVVVEARDSVGGTWDLFRYPGVRSDSDMATLGYSFRPWTDPVSIADGAQILDYIKETAEEHGLLDRVRLGHRVTRASWSSEQAVWSVELSVAGTASDPGEAPGPVTRQLTCSFLFLCTGYYDYAEGYQPDWAGLEDFTGELVHPQHWPPGLELAGKDVVVIGSGATAVTLVPALAETAGSVTMLQRSPTYIVASPRRDGFSARAARLFGVRHGARLTFWKNVCQSLGEYHLSRRAPRLVAGMVRRAAAERLPEDFDLDRHLTPTYDPWDQRMCLAPDGDFFDALNGGGARVVTDTIDRFTPGGIRLTGGEELSADVVVTATGLRLLSFGGIALERDGEPVDVGSLTAYRALMLCGLPNLAWAFGYTNASWTLKVDLAARYVGRLLDHMEAHGYAVAEPLSPRDDERAPMVDLASGYVRRGIDTFPRQGVREPWRLRQNYLVDAWELLRRGVTEEMRFETRPSGRPGAATPRAARHGAPDPHATEIPAPAGAAAVRAGAGRRSPAPR